MGDDMLYYTGWWLTYPSEKWWSESQLGLWHSQDDGKNKIPVPNHQSVYIDIHTMRIWWCVPCYFGHDGVITCYSYDTAHRDGVVSTPDLCQCHWGNWRNKHVCLGLKFINEVKTIINYPFGCGIYDLFMVIWGMAYYCFNHIIYNYI